MATAGGLGGASSSSANGRAPSAAPMTTISSIPVRAAASLRPVEDGGDGDQEARARVLELHGQLVGGVRRVDGGVDPADRRDRVEGHHVLGAVRAVDRHHVALADAAARQAGRRAPDGLLELPVRQDAAAGPVDDRRLVAEPPRVPQHVLRDGDVGHRDVGAAAPDDRPAHGVNRGEPLIHGSLSPALRRRQGGFRRRPRDPGMSRRRHTEGFALAAGAAASSETGRALAATSHSVLTGSTSPPAGGDRLDDCETGRGTHGGHLREMQPRRPEQPFVFSGRPFAAVEQCEHVQVHADRVRLLAGRVRPSRPRSA